MGAEDPPPWRSDLACFMLTPGSLWGRSNISKVYGGESGWLIVLHHQRSSNKRFGPFALLRDFPVPSLTCP